MGNKKMKQKIAVVLAAVLMLQDIPLSVLAAEQETSAAAENEAVQKEASGVNITYHTQDEIRRYIETSGATIMDDVTFQEEPVTEAPFALGKLSDETLDSAVRMLNQIRYIAGIPYDVVLDDGYNEKTQAASLVNYVNREMTHYPEQPEGMPDDIYALAKEGAGSSNIAMGSGTSWKLNYFIAMSWMKDGDSSNIDRVGHRRWLLNPSMKKTGFGLVRGVNGTHSAVYAFDRTGAAEEYGVMWPAQNMPTDYFNSEFPWSISMGTEVDASTVQVTLTRKSDGMIWNFSKSSADGPFYVNNDGYGQAGCIIFRPDGVDAYNDGDSYDVNISGLSEGDVSYTVNFFDLIPKAIVESVSVSPQNVEVETGKTQQFKETVTVINGAETTVTWSVSGNKSKDTSISQTGLLTVAEDEEATTLTVKATSKADTTKYSEAIVTVIQHTPGTETPGTETPGTETPGTETPGTETPGTETPGTETPGTETPDSEIEIEMPVPEKGKTYTVGKLKYKITKSASKSGTVMVIAPKNKTYKIISIPATVKINGYTFKVTAIANKAFKGNKKLTKVTIGSNVTSIGASAFSGDKQLATITIGKSVIKIGRKAFYGDKKLVTIKINTAKLKTVNTGAFKGIAKNAKVRVPKGKAKSYQKLLKKGGLPAKANVK